MFVAIILLIVLYFVPTFIATWRNSRHTQLAVLLNTALGWTIIGWLAALVLALMRKQDSFAGPKSFPTTGGYPVPGTGPNPAIPQPGLPNSDGSAGFTRE